MTRLLRLLQDWLRGAWLTARSAPYVAHMVCGRWFILRDAPDDVVDYLADADTSPHNQPPSDTDRMLAELGCQARTERYLRRLRDRRNYTTR